MFQSLQIDLLLARCHLGKRDRVPTHACLVNTIRSQFPSEDYYGFEYAFYDGKIWPALTTYFTCCLSFIYFMQSTVVNDVMNNKMAVTYEFLHATLNVFLLIYSTTKLFPTEYLQESLPFSSCSLLFTLLCAQASLVTYACRPMWQQTGTVVSTTASVLPIVWDCGPPRASHWFLQSGFPPIVYVKREIQVLSEFFGGEGQSPS